MPSDLRTRVNASGNGAVEILGAGPAGLSAALAVARGAADSSRRRAESRKRAIIAPALP